MGSPSLGAVKDDPHAPHAAGSRVSGHPDRPANRLAGTQSPYLLQHAHNPVDWWPWGAEAIAEARRRQVPLFVSIGYSTCYWCHVMERESFESVMAAGVLNEACVPVKVDREQRPDVDELMMTACQVFTQLTEGRSSGGWPLNVFLDPQTLEPFFCGTYFPPQPAFGRPSFVDLVRAVDGAWKSDRAGMAEQAKRIADIVRRQMALPTAGAAGDAEALGNTDTAEQVGFGGAPKFPTPPYPRFLMDAGGPAMEQVVRRTLDAMAIGGLFDQVGGGFHRYTVDATWTVPHFEKMLYDNGQLASLYADAFRRWRDPFHAETARRTCEYVVREMIGEGGRFLSAQDAEVDAREGANYVWTPEEARAALEAAGCGADWAFAARLYGLDGAANFKDPHHADAPAVHVLRLSARPDALAREMGITEAEFAARRTRVDAALLAARSLRRQPGTDDKTISAWSGLMAEGMADAGAVLGEPAFLDAAARAASFVLVQMRSVDGTLRRTWRGGANACLALADATGGPHWRGEARALLAAAEARFLDPTTGAWFDTAEGAADLFVRVRSVDDGAVPSGTASILRAMVRLGLAERDVAMLNRAGRAIAAIAPALREQPVASSGTVLAARALVAARQAIGG
ncbi:MAG: thioredoxin domain-containing protein [Proteobacteria bacterium]|nr:thioredoxin domain-containing protein [Pseudomonadota bacterium]